MQSIQMQLSKKQKYFFQFFSAVLELKLNFNNFEKKDYFIVYVFWKLQTAKDVVR